MFCITLSEIVCGRALSRYQACPQLSEARRCLTNRVAKLQRTRAFARCMRACRKLRSQFLRATTQKFFVKRRKTAFYAAKAQTALARDCPVRQSQREVIQRFCFKLRKQRALE